MVSTDFSPNLTFTSGSPDVSAFNLWRLFCKCHIFHLWGFHCKPGETTDGNCSTKRMNKSWRNTYHQTEDMGTSRAELARRTTCFVYPTRQSSSLPPMWTGVRKQPEGLHTEWEDEKLLQLLKAGSQEAAAVTWSFIPYLVAMLQLVIMVKLWSSQETLFCIAARGNDTMVTGQEACRSY